MEAGFGVIELDAARFFVNETYSSETHSLVLQ